MKSSLHKVTILKHKVTGENPVYCHVSLNRREVEQLIAFLEKVQDTVPPMEVASNLYNDLCRIKDQVTA